MVRVLPGLDTLPEPAPSRRVTADAFWDVAALAKRAGRLLERLYGKPGRTPHGFLRPQEFMISTVGYHVRGIIYKLLVRRLVDRAIRQGKLRVIEIDGQEWIDAPSS